MKIKDIRQISTPLPRHRGCLVFFIGSASIFVSKTATAKDKSQWWAFRGCQRCLFCGDPHHFALLLFEIFSVKQIRQTISINEELF